jgi:hypothetical protein
MKPSRFWSRCVAALLLTGALLAPRAGDAGSQGLVRVTNASRVPVTILVQNVDRLGYRQWRPIGTVAPDRTQEFAAVPAGAVFGAQAADRSRQWQPFVVTYPPNSPVFSYTLAP